MTAPALTQLNYLSDADTAALNRMNGVIQNRQRRNNFLSLMYDGRRVVQSLGIAVTPAFNQLETVVGWSGTAVDRLIERRNIDHISAVGSDVMTATVNQMWTDNDMPIESVMLATDESIHGISFNSISRADDGSAIFLPTPATKMTMEYDRPTRRTTLALADNGIVEKRPNMTFMKPDVSIQCERDGKRWRILDVKPNPSGIVPVVRFVNRPRHDRPWGASDITPAIISYIDMAIRTLLGMEVSREFFAAPQRVALNISEDAFIDSKTGRKKTPWEVYTGNFLALSGEVDDEGNAVGPPASITQLPASSPAPFTEIVKMLSQLMTSETGFPPQMWGFVTENPPSGDGARMAENTIVNRAKNKNIADMVGWSKSVRLGLVATGVPVEQLPAIQVVYCDPATHTPATTTDAVSKQIDSGALPATSDVALEKLGYTRDEVQRIKADRRTANAGNLVRDLAAAGSAARGDAQVTELAAARVPA